MNKTNITVTSPLLPDLDEFHELLKDIWDRKWITNNGEYHQRLEQALAEYLKVPYISLFTNETLPLLTALQALRITGEVITTPYSFVATTHSIWWNGCRPVFVDIEEDTCGIDPNKIEAAITPKTTAIMPVHCYGMPVKMRQIQEIADKYGLKVIYDAAHAFGVESLTPSPSPVERGGSPTPDPSPVGRGEYGGYRETAAEVDYGFLKERAREMRKQPTEAENLLWQALRNDQIGYKFRRQHPFGEYIADFICFETSVVIEVDGGYHHQEGQVEQDMVRDRFFRDKGFSVLRISNEEVLCNFDNTIARIKTYLKNFPLQGGQRGAWASVLSFGDMSTLSFHATKVYNTLEGGALVMHDAQTKQRIDYLKNFGFAGETEVVAPGINSKVDEVRCAYGLLNLKQVDAAIEARKNVARQYVEALKDVKGIRLFPCMLESFGYPPYSPLYGRGAGGEASPLSTGEGLGVRLNYSYFPIFVDARQYGMTRDELYFKMRDQGILGRRYFYPLISTFSTYRGLPSAAPENLPVATKIANEVICLPMHHALTDEDIQRILNCIIPQ